MDEMIKRSKDNSKKTTTKAKKGGRRIKYVGNREKLHIFPIGTESVLVKGVKDTIQLESFAISIAVGIIVAVISTISLVFGYSSREQLHNELKRKFVELEKSMIKYRNPAQKTLNEITAERLSIEADEPDVVRTLDILCHNEMLAAQGYGKPCKIGWIRSLMCQMDLPGINSRINAYCEVATT
ncbi:MAG: hypothetical protein LBH25_07520 [Fibromonadaceae bacterium]|jgi:hypothetical protein|nr:hypothetical protein [Fibromonadaceae bacterium]